MSGRRLAMAAAALGLVLGPAAPARGAAGSAVDVVRAPSGDAAGVVVTGVQPAPGIVEFFLSARDLAPGVSLADAQVTVSAGGTVLPSTTRAANRAGADTPLRAVVLVLDTSGSMSGTRLAAAQAAAADYAAAAPTGVWLGLVTVSDRATVVLEPTADRAAFTAAVQRIAAGGRTALYDGVGAATDLLDPKVRPAAADFLERRMIVLSDGGDTASQLSTDRLLPRLARAHAVLDAVAFGDGADQKRLAELTGATGGRVLPAGDAEALRSVFRQMAGGLSAPVVVRATVPPSLAGRDAVLRVQVALGAWVAAADTPVTFRADPAAGPGPRPFVVPPARVAGLVAALAPLAGAIVLLVLLVRRAVAGRGRIQRRLRQLDHYANRERRSSDPAKGAGGTAVVRAALAFSERVVREPDRRERLELALDRAGSALRVAEWQLIRLGCAVVGAVLATLVLPWWCGPVVGLLAGWCGTAQFLRWRAARRTKAFAGQLPDALQLVVGSLRSGFSLPQSLDALVREAGEPVAGELGRALAETKLGGDLEAALERVGQRNASQDMAWLVMAIRIQREVGGNLSEVLETAVVTMRERARLARHVLALSAEGRLSAMVLLGMPIVLGAWMFAFRRDYLRPLYTEPLGLAMLIGSIVMVIIGAVWLRKLVRVEV